MSGRPDLEKVVEYLREIYKVRDVPEAYNYLSKVHSHSTSIKETSSMDT